MTNTEKMRLLAKSLGQLNDRGNVKCRRTNSKGHAEIISICKGGSIWLIHENDDDLRITLEFTESAEENEFYRVRDSKGKFQNLFPGSKIFTRQLSQSSSKNGCYVSISENDLREIHGMIEQLKQTF